METLPSRVRPSPGSRRRDATRISVSRLDDRLASLPGILRATRRSLGWTQSQVAGRAGTSQSAVSRAERGAIAALSIATLLRLLDALDIRIEFVAHAPFVSERRGQRDVVHARCMARTVVRLERAGWIVLTEVEVVHGRSHGWIDILAYRPSDRSLMVIEVKTVLDDMGALERQVHWDEREAFAVARRAGWVPARVVTCLLVLATERNESWLRANAEYLRRSFPYRARDIGRWLAGATLPAARNRAFALIDPRSRGPQWPSPSLLDGRRSPAPYLDYADAARSRR